MLRGFNDGIACLTSRGTRCQDHEGKVAFTVESLTRKVAWSHILILHAVATIDWLLIFRDTKSTRSNTVVTQSLWMFTLDL